MKDSALRNAFRTMGELIDQLKKLPDEALERLLQRMNYVEELLSADKLMPINEFKAIMDEAPIHWLPKPSRIYPTRHVSYPSDLLIRENFGWRHYYYYIPCKLENDFINSVSRGGPHGAEYLRSHGFDFCMLPTITLHEIDDIWKMSEISAYQGWLENERLTFPYNRIEQGVYLVDTHLRPSDSDDRWENDQLMEEVIGRLQDQKRIDMVPAYGRGHRLMKKELCRLVADLFKEILEELGYMVEWVRLETVPEWRVLNHYHEKAEWPRHNADDDYDSRKSAAFVWVEETLDNKTSLMLADSIQGVDTRTKDDPDWGCVRLITKLNWDPDGWRMKTEGTE